MFFYLILIILILLVLFIINYTDSYRYISLDYNDIYELDRDYKYKKKIKNFVISLITTPNRI